MTATRDRTSVLVANYAESAPAPAVLDELAQHAGYTLTAEDIAHGIGEPVRAVVRTLNALTRGDAVRRWVPCVDGAHGPCDYRGQAAVWGLTA